MKIVAVAVKVNAHVNVFVDDGRRGFLTPSKRLGYSAHQFVALALQDQLRDAGLKMTVKIEAA